MRYGAVLICALATVAGAGTALAAECRGNPEALGVSRTLVIDPAEHLRLGTMQYPRTLPLADREVVLTFDDGPLPPYSNVILDILASECVKATYFIVGRMARAYPSVVRRVAAEGHTIGTHSQSHPFTFHKMGVEKAQQEVDQGIASTVAALDNPKGVAPFFRIPGLLRAAPVESYLASRKIATWSADFPADDWMRKVNDKEIVRRALSRLEAKGKGILLLHDIHPATVLALPVLLRALKARGYRIVHVVAAGAEQPKTLTGPEIWVLNKGTMQGWPKVAGLKIAPAAPVLPVAELGGNETATPLAPKPRRIAHGRHKGRQQAARPAAAWPGPATRLAAAGEPILPLPEIEMFGIAETALRTGRTPALRAALEPEVTGSIAEFSASSRTEKQAGRWPFAASAIPD